MEYIIIIIIATVLLVLLKKIFAINMKEIKKLAENEELDKIAAKFPNNVEICKKYLKKLNNENVKIEESKNTENCLYIAITNKIIIADLKNNYSRIQTIAHECLHSIQDRGLLIFNFIFSNIYLSYFVIISIMGILKLLPNKMVFVNIYIILGLVYYMVRSYLENDAMIKAKYLAKDYMEDEKIVEKNEINYLIQGFDSINKIGIKCVNYNLFMGILIKLIIFLVICLLR